MSPYLGWNEITDSYLCAMIFFFDTHISQHFWAFLFYLYSFIIQVQRRSITTRVILTDGQQRDSEGEIRKYPIIIFEEL